MYLEGSRNHDEVGHYTSLMNPEFITTGFAIGQDPGNDVCHEESFQYDDANKKSVARYKSLFLEYYNKTRDALEEAEYNLKTGKTGDAYSGRYSDVSNKMWYYDVVERVSSLGLMTGTSDTEFSPNGTMSRAMVVTVLYRMAGQPAASSTSAFKDVKDGLWYTAPINWAVENGIATGYNADSFGPNDSITREQICVMIYRFMGYIGLKTSAKADLSQFEDESQISDYARDAVQYCVAKGIISGSNNGTRLNPKTSATRAECAKIFVNAYDLYH